MLSSGENASEIGDAVPGRGKRATSSGFISGDPDEAHRVQKRVKKKEHVQNI